MFATFFTLTLIAAPAPTLAARIDRHAGARQTEAHQALTDSHAAARLAAGALYQATASRVLQDRGLAQQIIVDISRGLDAGDQQLARVREGLDATRRDAVGPQLRELEERHAKAWSHANQLKNALADPATPGGEVRFLAAEVYTAVTGAEAAHTVLMRRLGLGGPESASRAR